MQFRTLVLSLALPFAFAGGAHAEVIRLIDNTQVAGKIIHYYDGMFAIEAAGGQHMEIPTTKIKSITFKLPPPRAAFSTPQKTFERYKDALIKNDVPRVVDCYALMYQGLVAAQLGQSGDDLKKMQAEFAGTRFDIKGAQIKGDRATLQVQRQKGKDVQTADVHLVLENGEWKMTP